MSDEHRWNLGALQDLMQRDVAHVHELSAEINRRIDEREEQLAQQWADLVEQRKEYDRQACERSRELLGRHQGLLEQESRIDMKTGRLKTLGRHAIEAASLACLLLITTGWASVTLLGPVRGSFAAAMMMIAAVLILMVLAAVKVERKDDSAERTKR